MISLCSGGSTSQEDVPQLNTRPQSALSASATDRSPSHSPTTPSIIILEDLVVNTNPESSLLSDPVIFTEVPTPSVHYLIVPSTSFDNELLILWICP